MSNRASVAAIALSLTFAAVRLGGPTSAAPLAVAPAGLHAFRGGTANPKGYTPLGGCSAYLKDELSQKPHEPADDENKGAATKLLNKFFGLEDASDPENDPIPAGVRYAVALAPDPRHTNLSLLFDREMSLLVQAAQDQGYDYNSSWLPWKFGAEQPLTHLGDRQYADELTEMREACPGIVLFRKRLEAPVSNSKDHEKAKVDNAYSNALVVFIVGEQPTGGIGERQWANAVEWLRIHATANSTADQASGDGVFRVLGPTFTGSLVSLSRALTALYQPAGGQYPKDKDFSAFVARFPNARILSGSVSGCPAIQWFQSQLPMPAAGNLRFGTFQENDSVHIYRFLQYLSAQGTRISDTAVLSEDETAYAASPLTPPAAETQAADEQTSDKRDACDFPYSQEDRPIHLVYPRDISAVRNAYEKQAVFDSSGLKDRQHAVLRDEAAPEGGQEEITDTIPSSSGSVAAMDQEATLYGLVSFLRNHHTRYLILRATNPLDVLFLTRFFHRAYPEAQVVTVGSDLLFRREIDTTEFRGVLSLSSYPLLPREQHWAAVTDDVWAREVHNHLVFPAHLAEGMYIAARYTLFDDRLRADGTDHLAVPDAADAIPRTDARRTFPLQLYRAFPTPDYADPFWMHTPDKLPTHPPTWLAAVGRDGYWPVAVLNGKQFSEVRLDGDSSPPPAPFSTMVALVAPPDADAAEGKGSVKSQHYELAPAIGNNGKPEHDKDGKPIYAKDNKIKDWAFNERLLLKLPLPWMICACLAVALVCYQLFGLCVVKGASSNGILFIFRTAGSWQHAALMGISCALAVMPLSELMAVRFIGYDVQNHTFLFGPACWLLGLAIVFLVPGGLLKRFWGELKRYGGIAVAVYCFSVVSFALMYRFAFLAKLSREAADPVAVPLFYRMVHITAGVSPLLPILLLTFGFYLWNWQATAGNLNLGPGRPELPSENLLNNKAQSRLTEKLGADIVKLAGPFCFSSKIIVVPAFFVGATILCFVALRTLPLLSIEGFNFNFVVNGILLLALGFTAAEAFRLYTTWVTLRKLLQAVGRQRLRRTIARLRAIDANSIWSVSGNVHRVQYDLLTKQLDAARRLSKFLPNDWTTTWLHDVRDFGAQFVENVEASPSSGDMWAQPVELAGVAGHLVRSMRPLLAAAVAETYNNVLTDAWADEKRSLNLTAGEPAKEDAPVAPPPLSKFRKVRAAEEFVAYHYIAFIQNIVSRMRTMILSMICLFITVCFAISFYPFVPRTETGVWLFANLVLIGGAVAYVYAGMERDEILSYMSNSHPGRLGAEFYIKLAGFLAGPLIGLLTTQFPAISETVLQWLQPGLDALGH